MPKLRVRQSKATVRPARAAAKARPKPKPKAAGGGAAGLALYLRPRADADKPAPSGRLLPLVTSGGGSGDVPAWSLPREAMKWSGIVRHRARWVGNERIEATLMGEAEAVIAKLLGHADADSDAAREDLAALADAEMIEVRIPFEHEGVHWEYRVFPWEFVLLQATTDLRLDDGCIVVRCLGVGGAVPSGGNALLHLESVPRPLRRLYDFDSERQMLHAAATLKSLDYPGQRDIDADALAAGELIGRGKARLRPAVIHVSGFDAHQGAEIMGWEQLPEGVVSWDVDPENPSRVFDGMLLRGAKGAAGRLVDAQTFAAQLFTKSEAPQLVSFNVYNSAARSAPLCVAQGAAAAIGFQDTFDDDLAELFFSALYRACAGTGWSDLPAAFRYAWSIVRAQGRALRGAGVVLWSRRSIADVPPMPLAMVQAQVAGAASRPRARGVPAGPDLAVIVTPVGELNYSILHNDGLLFDRFSIAKTRADVGRVDDIEIKVALHTGDEVSTYETRAAIDEHASMREFSQDIKVPLTSALGRAQRESVRTSLFVEVAIGLGAARRVLYRDTHRVTLLSVDEWRDDDVHRIWLPSFVLPRDPAVLRVIESAQRYLMALRDDPGAGFDGYQAVEGDAPAPEDCALLDRQVQAIWSALIYEYSIAYVNPPPTFTEASQRLRTPSDVLDGKRGTCIDLALLLAACLEYVDIHAGIVLLKAHAFPVYWRHDSYLEAFRMGLGGDGEGDQTHVGAGKVKASWSIGSTDFKAIKREIDRGRLVPIETVMLTQHVGFADAIEEGRANLRSRADFDSLLDVTLARTDAIRPVTPLPVRREGER